MKYIFIINPAAGQVNSEQGLIEELQKRKDFDYHVFYTKFPEDATYYIRELCRKNIDKEYCFVACGGDGTINEVVNGIYGFPNACFTCWPCGSGNDYVKYYGGAANFLKLDNLLNGEIIDVDVMHVANKYSVNVINFGFDCKVVNTMEKVRRNPILGGKNAYTTGVATALFTGRNNQCYIYGDDELLNKDGKYLLCTIANGSYVGGSYNCAPRSIVDDGLMEVCMAKVLSAIKFISMSGKYKKGLHLDDPSCKEKIIYRQCAKVELISDEVMDLCIDGEIIKDKHFIIENIHNGLRFVKPKNV